MSKVATLEKLLTDILGDYLLTSNCALGELTIEVAPENILEVCALLTTNKELAFEQLLDITAVDYLAYGKDEWQTTDATSTGFSRGVDKAELTIDSVPNRFTVVYHLLSLTHNFRLRVKCYLPNEKLIIASVVDIWSSANWYEREVFDLFGILFEDHPDLRRILTDYGFIGHPLRKDFPTSGHVEVRFCPEKNRVIYQPVTIEPRVLVPKVIREDSRYSTLKANDALREPKDG